MYQRQETKIGEQELRYLRSIRIHKLLGVRDTGRRVSSNCPIHNGNNPQAFHVYPDNSYYCFNCGAHGSGAIDFVKDVDGCTFEEAVEQLIDYL